MFKPYQLQLTPAQVEFILESSDISGPEHERKAVKELLDAGLYKRTADEYPYSTLTVKGRRVRDALRLLVEENLLSEK